MQLANKLSFCARFVGFATLLAVCGSTLQNQRVQATTSAMKISAQPVPATKPMPLGHDKAEVEQGELVGPAVDCDGDGFDNDSRIDFDGDGIADDCVSEPEAIPEPPFAQDFTPTKETFEGLIPNVGWAARYQCGDGLYEVTLRRPSQGEVEYASDGLTLSSSVVYDDIDPNLNQPLVIRDPADGLRYSFQQESDGEFYEYAIANYGGDVGLYIYQTGEQIVAAPCESVAMN